MDGREHYTEMLRKTWTTTLKLAFKATVAVLSVCLTMSALAQAGSTQEQPETITSTMELSRLHHDPSADGRPVDLKGRLVFAAPKRRLFRIQSEGRYVACQPDLSIPDIALTFEAGDLIRVKGCLQSHRTGREPISVTEVSLIRKGTLDDLEFVEAFEGDDVRMWQYVSFTGTVSELIAEGAATRIAFEDQYFGVEAYIATNLPLSRQRDLVGRRINVKGMMLSNPAASREQNHCVRILAMSKDQVTVVDTDHQPRLNLHKIDGQIAEIGGDYVIVGGAKAMTRVPHLLHPGSVVSVEVSDWNPKLRSGQLRWLHNRGTTPFPDVPTIESIPPDNRLMYSSITVSGIVVKTIINGRFTRVYLSTIAEAKDRQIIVAVVPASVGERVRDFKPGTKILASGVLHPASEFATEADYRLNTSSFNGFEIITDNNELQLRRLKMLVGLGIVCLLAGTVWHYSLRRQVKQKTASLRSLMSHSTAAIQSVSQGILVMDKDGRVSMSNANMQTLFGSELESIAVNSHLVNNILARRFADHAEFASLWAASLNDPMKTLAREFKTVAPAGWMAVYTAPALDA